MATTWVDQMRALNSARLARQATAEYKPTSMTKSVTAEREKTPVQQRAGTTRVSGVEVPSSKPYSNPSWNKQPEDPAKAKEETELAEKEKLRNSELKWRQGGTAVDQVASFTPEQMAGLSDDQRALVNAQSQLWAAIQADRSENAKLTVEDRARRINGEDYSAALKDLFAAGNGSNTYAPRTVAALSELGLESDITDLDMYLNGSTMLSNAEVLAAPDMPLNNKTTFKYKHADRLATSASSDRLAPLLEKGYSILTNIASADGYSFMEGVSTDLSPEAEASKVASLSPEQIENLRYLMADMAMIEEPGTLGDNYAALQEMYGLDDNMVGEFLREELTNWESGATTFGEGYITPQEFRAKWQVQ